MTATPQARPRRAITAAQYRAAREWVEARTDLLADWSTAEKVLAAVAALIAGVGSVDQAELRRALHEVETVDAALDLLAACGVGCT